MTVEQLIEQLKVFNPDMELYDENIYPLSQSNTSEALILNFASWTEKTDNPQGYLLLLSVHAPKSKL